MKTDDLRKLLTKIENAAKWDLPCEATSDLIAGWAKDGLALLPGGNPRDPYQGRDEHRWRDQSDA